MTLQDLRVQISNRLKVAGIEAYDYETWVFLEWKLGINRGDYYMNPSMELPEEGLQELEEVICQREKRFPLQYIMNHCDFMGYDFYVDERVLVPRMDTECLVEQALAFLRQQKSEDIRILDMCTGSGCIGISIKLLFPKAKVYLADLSEGALEVAKRNAQELGAEVEILQGDLFEALWERDSGECHFDLVVSNPPYIPSKVVEDLMPEVKDYEPHMALDGMDDGLFFYERISQQAPSYMKKGAALIYEIGAEQGEDVSNIMKEAGFDELSVIKDLAGLDRIVMGRLS